MLVVVAVGAVLVLTNFFGGGTGLGYKGLALVPVPIDGDGGGDGGGGIPPAGPANGSYVSDSFGPSATIYNGPYNSGTNYVSYTCLSGICSAYPSGNSCVNTTSFTKGSNGGTTYMPHNSYNERTSTINLTSWSWDDEGGGNSRIGGGAWQFNWSHTGCSCNLSCTDEVGSNCAGSASGPVAVSFSLTQPLNTNGYAYNRCESGSGYGTWGAFVSNYQATNIACNSGYVIFGNVSNPGSTTSCASPAGTISASQTSCLTGSSCGTITTTINHRWGSVVKLVNVTTGISTVWQTIPVDPTANTSPSSQFSYSQNFTAPATAGQYKFSLYNNTGNAILDATLLSSTEVITVNTTPTQPDFTLNSSNAIHVTILAGGPTKTSTDTTITITSANGFSSNVTLSASSDISGAIYNFITNPLISSKYSTGSVFSITIPSATTKGPHTITIQGADGGLIRTVNVILNVESYNTGWKEF